MKKAIRVLSLALAFLFVIGLMPIGELSTLRKAEAETNYVPYYNPDEAIKQASSILDKQHIDNPSNGCALFVSKVLAAGGLLDKNGKTSYKATGAGALVRNLKDNNLFGGNSIGKVIYNPQKSDISKGDVLVVICNGSRHSESNLWGFHVVIVSDVNGSDLKSNEIRVFHYPAQDSYRRNTEEKRGYNTKINLTTYMNYWTKCKICGTVKGQTEIAVFHFNDNVKHHHSVNSYGNCSCGKYHEHQYGNDGKCAPCIAKGKADSYKDSRGLPVNFYDDTNANNYIIAKEGEKLGAVEKKQWSLLPFTVYSDMAGSRRAGTASSGEIVSIYRNHKDYLENKDTDKVWYGLRVPEISGTVYVQGDSVEAKMSSRISITNESYPEARVLAGGSSSKNKGYAYTTVKGTVTATDSKVAEVTIAIFKEDDFNSIPFNTGLGIVRGLTQGKGTISAAELLAMSKTVKPQYIAHAQNINKATYKLEDSKNKTDAGKTFDSSMGFSKLKAGCSYVYILAATDTYGVSTTARHPFYVESSSSAKSKCMLTLSSGEAKSVEVEKGSTYILPTKSRPDMDFIGWSSIVDAEEAEFPAGYSYTVTKDTTLYAVFQEQDVEPPAAPVLSSATYDIAVGDAKTITWGKVDGATKYIAFLYDENNLAVDFQTTETNTPSISIPFETAGTYFIHVAGMNKAGYGDESTGRVTVNVHEDVSATFMNYNGAVWTTYDAVRYGRSAAVPSDPMREGYTFLGWTDVEGSSEVKQNALTELKEDKTFYPVYSAIPYSVTFYDKDGGVLSTQNVTYIGDVPGSATPPTPPAVDGYTFLEWNTQDYLNVRESGIKIYPVYMQNEDLAATTMPMSIHIDSVEAEDNGYWVYYSVTNNRDYGQLGRVVLAGKTVYGKFVTQTESGAFYLRSRAKSTAPYQGNAYIPVSEADMATLAKVQVYVVDSYQSTRPIAEMDEEYVENGASFGEYSQWLTEEQLATVSYVGNRELGTQYRYRVKLYQTTNDPVCPEGWEPESVNTVDGGWGEWSPWQYEPVTESETRQVNTEVETVSEAYTEYRYGRWYGTNVVGKQSGNSFSAAASPAFAHADANYKNASSKFQKNYSAWGTKRLSAISDTFHTSYHDSEQTWFKISSGQYYWHIYYNGSKTAANKYFWEESRTVPAVTREKYQYRDKNEATTTYTYSCWSDWSVWSNSSETPSGEVEVETRPVYRVLLTGNNSQGMLHIAQANLGSAAANKQAIITVYKVDAASDYSNQYINQVTMDENGSYEFSFYTLEEPTPETGDFTVSLTVEDATEPIYLDPIPVAESAMRRYTVTFVDEVTGLPFNVQNVIEGRAAVAPEIPDHPEFYFLGWEYGLGNIRENMTIRARFVPKLFTVVFVDAVNCTVDMYTDLPYGSDMPSKADPSEEGYRFLGWRANGGPVPTTVEGHMIVTAEYEHISYKVSYIGTEPQYDSNGNIIPLLTQDVFYGEYADDPFGYEGEYDEFDEEEPSGEGASGGEGINISDLNIPDSMYFAGWSEGVEDPIMGSIVLSPVLNYYYDTAEVMSSLDGGIYVGEQTLTLLVDAEEQPSIPVQYRIISVGQNEDDVEWIDYDLTTAPEITISATCLLQIEAQENDKNGFNAEYEYILVSQEELPATPSALNVAQTETDCVAVTWSAVDNVTGYLLCRTSDWGEVSEFMVEGTSFIDYGVEPLRAYSYSVCGYRIAEKNGASLLLNGDSTEEQRVFFFGGYTPVSGVEITGVGSVYAGSAVQLTAVVSPAAAYDPSVVWTATNGTGEGYVTRDGMFYGTTPGTVTVTATAQDGSGVTATTTIEVDAISSGAGFASLTVSSAQIRAGGNATVSVSISEDSLLQSMQFAVVYDNSKLTLVSVKAGEVTQNEAPDIGTTEEGVVYFTWLDIESLVDGGSVLDLTFRAKANSTGTALLEIPTSGSKPFAFSQADSSPISVASINGALSIQQLLLGDVNENGTINIVDASLIRRYTVKLVELTETQLLAADVNGDGVVNVLDAHMIRRYIAHLLDAFPAA